jgi:uncharacterized protein (DUF2141 family)
MKTFVAISALSLALAACGGAEQADNPPTDDTAMADGEAMGDGTMPGDMTDDPMATTDPTAATGPMAGDGMMADGADVTVNVSGIEPGPGQLMVALQTQGEFAKAAGAYSQMMAADAATETVTFEGVEPGSYAAAVVHDTNENGKVDMGDTGPTEGWGLSGDAQKGAPEFDPAMFEVTDTGGTADVAMTYPE